LAAKLRRLRKFVYKTVQTKVLTSFITHCRPEKGERS